MQPQQPIRKSQQEKLQRAQVRRRFLFKAAGSLILLGGIVWAGGQLPWQVWLQAFQPQPAPEAAEKQPALLKKDTAEAKSRSGSESIDTVEFSFYKALPKLAVEVDVDPLPVKLEQPVVIMAGTFRQAEAAQRELSRLQRLGFDNLRIRTFEKGSRMFYQLRSVPLDNKLEVIRLRNRLQKAGARVLVIKASPQNL